MLNASNIKDICAELDIIPTKNKGQNFLIDEHILDKIVETAQLRKEDIVLEVGPGFGVLTERLLGRVKKVKAVELDKKLFKYLHDKFVNHNNLELVQGDILNILEQEMFIKEKYKVVANLPYQISSHFLRKIFELKNKPKTIVLLLQKEVGERMTSKPGDMSILSVMVQYYANPKIISVVSKNSFWPIPAVESVIIKLETKNQKSKLIDDKLFFQVVKVGFAQKRKMLKNNLSNVFDKKLVKQAFEELKLDEKIRAQDLDLKQWISLAKKCKTN